MRNHLLILLITAILAAGCAPGTPGPDLPTNSETPSAPGAPDYLPRPTDGTLTRSQVYLDSIDLLTMESYPLQFSLALRGSLPTPCNQLRVQVEKPDTAGLIAVDVYSVVNPKAVCVQVLEPFEVNIPLGSFPAGHYKLVVNGQPAAEFDA